MRTVDQLVVNGGKKVYSVMKEANTGVFVYAEMTYSKKTGIKHKIIQAHEKECIRMMDKAKLHARKQDEMKAA